MSTKTLFIDGRELVITDNSTKKLRYIILDGKKEDVVEHIIEDAQDTFREFKYAKFFPRIGLVISDQEGGTFMSADSVKAIIYVSLSHYHERIPKMLEYQGTIELTSALEHEIAHLYHQRQSNYLVLKAKIRNKTYVKAIRAIPLYKLIFHEWYGYLRVEVQDFFMKLLSEGIADHIRKTGAEKIEFDEDYFNYFHEAAVKAAVYFKQQFQAIIPKEKALAAQKKVKEFKALTNGCPYRIGPHMVYTILYFNKNVDLEDIFKMKSYHKFARLYAETMLVNKREPIVVSTTGKFNAILDYNELLAEIQASYKKSNSSKSLWKRVFGR